MHQNVAGPHAFSDVTLYLPHPVLVPDSLSDDTLSFVLTNYVLIKFTDKSAWGPRCFHVSTKLIKYGLNLRLIKLRRVEEMGQVYVVIRAKPHLALLCACVTR